eukprot:Opistho-2@96827
MVAHLPAWICDWPSAAVSAGNSGQIVEDVVDPRRCVFPTKAEAWASCTNNSSRHRRRWRRQRAKVRGTQSRGSIDNLSNGMDSMRLEEGGGHARYPHSSFPIQQRFEQSASSQYSSVSRQQPQYSETNFVSSVLLDGPSASMKIRRPHTSPYSSDGMGMSASVGDLQPRHMRSATTGAINPSVVATRSRTQTQPAVRVGTSTVAAVVPTPSKMTRVSRAKSANSARRIGAPVGSSFESRVYGYNGITVASGARR